MKGTTIKLTREELYERVWSVPATKLSKEFGISDVALGKICKKLNIPKPYPGYWQQLAAGQRVQKEKLPPLKKGELDVIYINPYPTSTPFKSENPEILAQVEQENQSANRISIGETLHNPHSLVRYTRQLLEKSKPDDYGRLGPFRDNQCLDMRVSKTTLHRALRIMDALLKAIEARGYSVEVPKNGDWLTSPYILIGNEKIGVRMWENSNRSEREPTKVEKNPPSYLTPNNWIYTPGGKLTFEIEHSIQGLQKRWTDRAQTPLQEQLNEILKCLILVGEAKRLKTIKREEEQRRRHEQERRQLEEQKRRDYFNKYCEGWTKSQHLRKFIQACETSLIERRGEIVPDSPEAKWLRWAHQYADRIDPLKNGSFEESIFISEFNS